MKVIIAGSRAFDNYELVCETLSNLRCDGLIIDEVVCGGARGADSLGERWAKALNIPIKYFYANWDEYGKAAGFIRNHEMGDYADYLVAFWDGKSRGTKDMINYMKGLGKHGKVVLYAEDPSHAAIDQALPRLI